jgi:hypothetical protein
MEVLVRAHRLLAVFFGVFVLSTLTVTRVQAQAGRGEFGSIVVRVVPPQAEVLIDGERWVGHETDGRLVVQVPPGRHHVEIRSPGYRIFESEVEVRAGESTPLNVSLVGAPPEQGPPPPGIPPPPPSLPPPSGAGRIHQVSDSGEESGFAISPDYRFADVNHHTAHLLGGYGGVVFSGHLFVGAGGYWQLDYSHRDLNIAYGGAVFEWRQWNTKPVGVTLHALVGGGDAHIYNNYIYPVYPGGPHPDPYRGGYYGYYDYGYHEGFFVFEPEAQVNVRLARDFRFSAGVGYRVTSTYHGAISGDQLNGVSGTISVRFGK